MANDYVDVGDIVLKHLSRREVEEGVGELIVGIEQDDEDFDELVRLLKQCRDGMPRLRGTLTTPIFPQLKLMLTGSVIYDDSSTYIVFYTPLIYVAIESDLETFAVIGLGGRL